MKVEIGVNDADMIETFLRRATFDDFRRRSENNQEAYDMIDASERLRRAIVTNIDHHFDSRS